MTEVNEKVHSNGISKSDGNDSDDGGDTAFENPVIKIFRGFPNMSDETIRQIRFEFSV